MKSHHLLLFVLDALAYLVCTFGFALFWHVWLFKPTYDALGWRAPDNTAIALGFTTIGIQAVLLSLIFQFVKDPARFNIRLAAFVGAAFVFLWTSHVLGDAAKIPFTSTATFIALETAYLAIQFVIYGAVLWIIHATFDPDVKKIALAA